MKLSEFIARLERELVIGDREIVFDGNFFMQGYREEVKLTNNEQGQLVIEIVE